MRNIKELMCIEPFAAVIYKKCGCCGRVRNLYYRMDVRDALTNTMLVGSINLCEDCGENFGAITQQKISKERTVTEFSFEQ